MDSKTFFKEAGLLLLVLAAMAYMVLMGYSLLTVIYADASLPHCPSWDQLNKSFKDFRFTSKYARRMAEKVLEYRMETEFKAVTDTHVSLFVDWSSSSPDQKVLFGSSMSDSALFKLATAPQNKFSFLVYYVPMFNHPRYVECMKAYNVATGAFNAVKDKKPTRDVIIQDILTTIKNKSALATVTLESMKDAELYAILDQGYVGTV